MKVRWMLLIVLIAIGGSMVMFATHVRSHQHRTAFQPASRAGITPPCVGHLMDKKLREASGLAASRTHHGVYWSINDSGNDADLFALDQSGKSLGAWRVQGAKNVDWEEIAIDNAGRLYIADTGDNRLRRFDQRILVVDEPDPRTGGGSVSVRHDIRLRFDSGHRNCEAIVVSSDSIYLIEKLGNPADSGKPGALPEGPAAMYRLPFTNASASASTVAKRDSTIQVASVVERYPFDGSVTAASLSRDQRQLVVLTSRRVYVFSRADDKSAYMAQPPWSMAVDCGQAEGICFDDADSGAVLIVNEGRQLFRLRWK